MRARVSRNDQGGAPVAEWITVGKADEIAEGDATAFDANGEQVAVSRVNGELHAFSDICTHRGCNLSLGGEIDGTTIECECHGSMFDIGTGAVVSAPATEPIATFPVQEVDGEIQVEA
jgi:nitrite reductase/ring-hydroxylating ferredoxin subunit